jgi:predicted nuclease of predicted toxin-antitoxin system
MKAAYLIDANLPFRVPVWQNDAFLFVVKINSSWDDEEIWEYARANNLVIVTKDKDFIVEQAIAGAPPNIVHVKFENLKLAGFIQRIETVGRKSKAFSRQILSSIFTQIKSKQLNSHGNHQTFPGIASAQPIRRTGGLSSVRCTQLRRSKERSRR